MCTAADSIPSDRAPKWEAPESELERGFPVTDETGVVQTLLAAVKSGDDEGAERAVHKLRVQDEASLIKWVNTTAGDLRWWAIRGLGQCGTLACVPAVLETLAHGDAALQAVSAWTLAHVERRDPGQTAVLSALAEQLAANDSWVRQTVADALALCGDAAVDVLGQAMAADEGIRVRAAYALAKIATLKSAPWLFRALDDDNPLVRAIAYEGLEAMGLLENVIVTDGE